MLVLSHEHAYAKNDINWSSQVQIFHLLKSRVHAPTRIFAMSADIEKAGASTTTLHHKSVACATRTCDYDAGTTTVINI